MDLWYPTAAEFVTVRADTEKLRLSDDLHWQDVRSRLLQAGIRSEDAVLADKVSAGRHSLDCVAVSRDERVFSFNMIFGYNRNGNPLPKGQGWVGRWQEIPHERVRLTDDGVPNSWLRAVIIARELIADERVPPT